MTTLSSKHLVDPELLPLLDLIPPLQLSAEILPALRAFEVSMLKNIVVPDLPVRCREVLMPGPEGAPAVRGLLYVPERARTDRPAILQIHGGGYVVGIADKGAASNTYLAAELDSVVLAVDYRRAPETPFPGPVEDCYAALKWLHANAGDLGVDVRKIAVTGESAGGGLAAALCLLARDRGEVPICFQHLIFPMLDDRTCLPEATHPYTGEFLWTRSCNDFGWTSLLGRPPGGSDVSEYAAPARTKDLSRLPPTFLICGALDLFVEENIEYARRLIRAGVATELHIYPGAPHGFMLIETAAVTQAFRRDYLSALRRALRS